MFRAYDAARERLVAVKFFKLDLPPERVHQLVAAFEQLIATELTHPALAVPLATGIADVSAYLATDYVAAESLDLAVREYGPAPPVDALRVAAQLAGALDFAAVVNTGHGALHPRDVLLSSDETRLTGIGVARALESVGVAAPVRRPYSAPERIAGAAWDRRADIFSLAALIHELLWGKRVAGTGSHIADTLTELPGGDLPALQNVFARALAQDPADRFETALEFADALKGAFPSITAAQASARKKPQPSTTAAVSRPESRVVQPPPRMPVETAESHTSTAAVDRRSRPGQTAPEPRLPLDVPDEAAPVAEAPLRAPESVQSTPDFEIHRSQDALDRDRFHDIGVDSGESADAPSIHTREPVFAVEATDGDHDRVPASPQLEIGRKDEAEIPERPPISIVDQSRSAVWPLVAALLIGLALGFAAGYGVGTREHTATTLTSGDTAPPAAQPAQPVTAASSATAGREATEVAIGGETRRPSSSAPAVPPKGEPAAAERRTPVPAPAPPSTAAPARGSRTTTERMTPRRAPTRPPARTASPPAAATDPASTTGRYAGILSVDSRPTGARVFLDGRLIGTTPLAMPGVPAGEHAIRIELDGYRRWSSSVRVVASEQNRVTASLER